MSGTGAGYLRAGAAHGCRAAPRPAGRDAVDPATDDDRTGGRSVTQHHARVKVAQPSMLFISLVRAVGFEPAVSWLPADDDLVFSGAIVR